MRLTSLQQRLVVSPVVLLAHLLLFAAMLMRQPSQITEPPVIEVSLLGAASRTPAAPASIAPTPSQRTIAAISGPAIPEPATPASTREFAVPPSAEVQAEPKPEPDATRLLEAATMPKLSLDTEPTPLRAAVRPDAAAPVAADPPSGAAACKLEAILQSTLSRDPKVRAALALVPRQARSVSNAIMLWNGSWVDAASLGDPAALAPIRSAVTQAVVAAPVACRRQPMRGPRFVAIGGAEGTTLLVFGSGAWVWPDLLGDITASRP